MPPGLRIGVLAHGFLPHAWAAERQRGRGAACATRQLCLIGPPAVFDAVWEAGVHRFTTEMEIGFAGMPHRPAADTVAQIEQAGLVRDFGAGLGRDQTARRRRRNRCLLIARPLTQEPTRTNRDDFGQI